MNEKYGNLHGNDEKSADFELTSSSRFLEPTATENRTKVQFAMDSIFPGEQESSIMPSTSTNSKNTPSNFMKKVTPKSSPVKNTAGLLRRLPSVEQINTRFRGSNSNENLAKILKHYGIKENNEELAQNKIDLPNTSTSNQVSPDHNEHNERLMSFGVSLVDTLSDIILSHPCLVLRRQAQVNNVGKSYHFTPFTIISAAVRLQKVQGFSCLWKGVGSGLICNVMSFGIENLVTETNPNFPREVSSHSTIKQLAGHILLKALSATITLPFFSAHLVESIQSDIASDRPGLFFCFTEGFSRLLGYGGVQSQRLLPFYKLLVPTVSYLVLKYTLSAVLRHVILIIIRTYNKWKHEQIIKRLVPKSPQTPNSSYDFLNPSPTELQQQLEESYLKSNFPELFATYLAQLIVDVTLFPLETIIFRLHVQGTRTIIDDMDKGSGFLPVNTRYTGFSDCVSAIQATEGVLGFYRGFGGLVLQQSLKFGVLKCLEVVLDLMSSV